MKRSCFILLISLLVYNSIIAQSVYGVRQVYSFYKTVFQGTLLVDEAGNPQSQGPDTVRIIYIEAIGKKKPIIDSVIIAGKLYTASVVAAGCNTEIGKKITTGKPIIIHCLKANSLWMVELTLVEGVRKSPVRANRLLLKGKYAGRRFAWSVIKKAIELETPLRG